MTEGITHCEIVMGRGGGGMKQREKNKNPGIMALTRVWGSGG